jgi:hypothetical protein
MKLHLFPIAAQEIMFTERQQKSGLAAASLQLRVRLYQ